MKNTAKQKIIVIVGPTASGKSDLAVLLAQKFNGEVVSADSRQVYKGLDIGTGKITRREMRGIPHHLLDVASPKRTYTASHFARDGRRAIKKIGVRGRIPIVVGGTGFYIRALVDDISIPEVPPNMKLRTELEKKNVRELYRMLFRLDRARAKTIERKNPRRLIRAIEIAKALGKVPPLTHGAYAYKALWIGIQTDDKILKQKIRMRLFARIRAGMIAEARRLHSGGLSWKRMESLGLEYRFLAQFLRKKITRMELEEKLSAAIWQYARRQKTWFKKNKEIRWISSPKNKMARKWIMEFLKK
ncbi:MAG: tRNA (adenosine(37)-N6)-dimethylallyltransferase MiaA [Patescibacteria group bacterium]